MMKQKMFRRLICGGLVVILVQTGMAQLPSLSWYTTIAGPQDDYGNGVDVDKDGNVYTVGFFKGTVDFDPGPGTFNMTSTSSNYNDIYVQKLTANGDFVWARRFNCGAQTTHMQAVAVDDSANVYITGCFRATADLNPGPGVYNVTANGNSYDPFLVKLNAAGNFVWAWTSSGTGQDYPRDIAVDMSGNVFIAGDFSGSLPAVGNAATGSDGFLIKFSPGGVFQWSYRLGASNGSLDCIYGINTDAQGNVYATGFFVGVVDFDAGPGVANLGSTGENRAFVLKMDGNRNYIWAKETVKLQGYYGIVEGRSVAVDPQGNVLVTGGFSHTVDFDPGPGTQYLVAADNGSNRDAFVWKLDVNGNYVWAKRMGNLLEDWGTDIATDASGNVYTLGYYFYSSVDFDPGPGTYFLYQLGAYRDIFVQKLDAAGNFVWAVNIGGSSEDYAPCIVIDPYQYIYLTGNAFFSMKMNPDTNSYVSYPAIAPGPNTFTAKWAQCAGTSSVINVSSCGNYTLNGQTYTASGTYTQRLFNAVGCDSTITLNLTIGGGPVATVTHTACDSYTRNGHTYTNSGTFTQTIPGVNGCDTTLTLHLTITNSTSSTLTQTSCDSYTLNGQSYANSGTYTQLLTNSQGCDSTLTLHLTITNSTSSTLTQTSCDSYTLNGQTYTNSGTFTQLLTNSQGCDSTLTLHLTITNSTSSTLTQTSCDSYTLNGQTYTNSGTYTQLLTNSQGCDSTLTLHLTITNSTSSTLTQTSCDSYTLNGQSYTNSGTYTQLLTNSQGCDSTITLHLTITNSTSSTLTQTSCDSYTLNGQSYTNSGTYTQLLTNAQGCDSTLTLHLTITNSTSSTLTQTSCDNYTLNGQSYTNSGTYTQLLTNAQGCDSTLTLHLTITHSTSSTLTQTSCDSYTLNGQLYTSGGIYTQNLINTAGCDSIVTLDLTIITIDNTVIQNNHILTASETNADYQWITCGNLQPIAGATSQVYTATSNGDYAVIVNNGTCMDTSACYLVVNLSVEEKQPLRISVFPNPASDMATIYAEQAWQDAVLRLYAISGTMIREISPVSGHSVLLDLTEYSPGVYFVEIQQAAQVFRVKLIKH